MVWNTKNVIILLLVSVRTSRLILQQRPDGALIAATLASNAIENGIILLDDNSHILFWNDWMVSYALRERQDVLGKSLFSVFPELKNTIFYTFYQNNLKSGLPCFLSQAFHHSLFPLYRTPLNYEKRIRMEQRIIIKRLNYEGNCYSLIQVCDVENAVIGERNLRIRAKQMQQMSEQLERQMSELDSLVKEQTKGLIIAKERAEKNSIAKSNFLASISHELRTPIHAILSFSYLGRERVHKIDRDKLQQYFNNIASGGERLLGVINNLIDFSKLEAGTMRFDKKAIALNIIVNSIINELQAASMSKNITIQLDYDKVDATVKVLCDKVRILQVFRNILENAIYFSPQDGVIHIKIALLADTGVAKKIQVSIADQGAGISENELKDIFLKFTQSNQGHYTEGTGLGLAICKDILEQHEEVIYAENAKSGGAIFTFTLTVSS